MKRQRVLLSLFVAIVVLATGSCSSDQSPTGVTAVAPSDQAPSNSLLGDLLRPVGLLQCTPMAAAKTTKTIGPEGGAIQIGPHVLWIPAGALAKPVTITATAPSDDVNSVQFSPSGLTFDKSAWLTMSYSNCNLLGRLLPKRIAYTSDDLRSVLYYLLSLDNLFSKQVTGKVDHFSRYAVSW